MRKGTACESEIIIRFLLLGIFQKICLKSFVDCLFHGLFAVVTYKKESPIDPYEILLFLVSMIMFRGDAFLSDPFFLCLLRPEYAPSGQKQRFPQLLLYFKPGELQIKFVPSFLKKLCEM